MLQPQKSKPQSLESLLETLIIEESHKTRYARNLELVRAKNKKNLNLSLDIEHMKKSCNHNKINNNNNEKNLNEKNDKEIYLFLGLLSIYEINIGKKHSEFLFDDWEKFSENMSFSDVEKCISLKNSIFKKNLKNFKWSQEEDLLLKRIMKKNNNLTKSGKRKWKLITTLFNQSKVISQFRKAPQIKERWENSLKLKFKRGEWELREDLVILNFVLENGSKWSSLSKKILLNRTEHAIKNRYFSLLRNFSSIPIVKIKKQKDYLDKFIIKEILKNYRHEEYDRNQAFNMDSSLDQISDSSKSNNNESLCLFSTKTYERLQPFFQGRLSVIKF